MSKIDLPDAKYGFWVALGIIAAFMLVAALRMALARATGKNG